MLQLELHENEVQPCIYIATLRQPSNRNVDRITIDFYKAGAKYMLINPPAQYDLSGAKFGSTSIIQDTEDVEIVKTVTERVSIIGPIPRSRQETSNQKLRNCRNTLTA